jgi:branched-chain amino acid transport system permease protein
MSRSLILRDLAIAAIALLVLALLPYIFPGKALSDFIIRVAAFGLFATSLNLLVGYAGLVSFGHGMFFGLGAYSFGLMMQKLGTSIPVAFVATLLLAAAVAALIGAICVRLKEIYFSFITLAFQMLMHSMIIAWTPVTGGDQGLTGGLPRPPFLGIHLDQLPHLYLFCCVMLVGSLLIMRHIVQSPFGYTLRMIRDNPMRAQFLGIKVWRMRLIAFILSGVFGSMGGILMGLFVSGAYPDFAYWSISGEAVFMIMLGGTSVFLGPLAGATMLLFFNDLVTRHTEHYGLFLGSIILLFALGLRKGLLDIIVEKWPWRTPSPSGSDAGRHSITRAPAEPVS